MKVLWITNVPVRDPELDRHEKSSPYGGWLKSLYSALADINEIDIAVASPSRSKVGKPKANGNRTYSFFGSGGSGLARRTRNDISTILDLERPDIVHVFGTELPHSLIAVETSNARGVPVIISIQGLVSSIANYVALGLPDSVVRGATVRNLILRDNIARLRRLYTERGHLEVEAIRSVKFVVGRTSFDRAVIYSHNPKAQYFPCEEILRDSFYVGGWNVDTCRPYRIFLSQGSNPLKGAHTAIKALAVVRATFPDTTLAIGGRERVSATSIMNRLKQTYYDRYLLKLIRELNLSDCVTFTGELDETAMRAQYLDANVFILASSIENSPNSLAEAMVLGTPCVASFAGGVPDMVTHRQDALCFPVGSMEMLAHQIMEVFSDRHLAEGLSRSASRTARIRHDPEAATSQLLTAYTAILQMTPPDLPGLACDTQPNETD